MYGQVEVVVAPQDRRHVEGVRLLDNVYVHGRTLTQVKTQSCKYKIMPSFSLNSKSFRSVFSINQPRREVVFSVGALMPGL